eukprot:1116127-Pyramimonas_sp.AAC.1
MGSVGIFSRRSCRALPGPSRGGRLVRRLRPETKTDHLFTRLGGYVCRSFRMYGSDARGSSRELGWG